MLSMSEWYPIDTAPKDGTIFLGWNGENMATVKWYEFKSIPGCWELVETGSYAADGYWNPTHWQSLPNPPDSHKT